MSGFSKANSNGAWSTAYLGAYADGVGVTDSTENGSNPTHKVDNVGTTNNYVLFEFSSPVIIDKAYLDFVGADSDMSAWIGTKTDPYNNHNTLSDAFLASLGAREDNNTSSTSAHNADINAGNVSGNVLVISAVVGGTNDEFKIHKLLTSCTVTCPTITVNPSSIAAPRKNYSYSATFTASGGSSPYTFTKSSGTLPNGLSLSSSGTLSGTPTSTGSFTFTVQATASNGCTGTRSYTVTVTN